MKQEMILTTEKLVFVTDPDESDKNIENLVTEFNTNLYRIKIDRTLKPPYYPKIRKQSQWQSQLQ